MVARVLKWLGWYIMMVSKYSGGDSVSVVQMKAGRGMEGDTGFKL